MRALCLSIAFALVSAQAIAGEASPPPAADAKAAELSKSLRTSYGTALLAAQERYRAVLEAELDKASKAGDLDAVTALRAELETCAADESAWKSSTHLLALRRFVIDRDAAGRKYATGLDAIIKSCVQRKELDVAEALRTTRGAVAPPTDEARLDLSQITREVGFWRIPPRKRIATKAEFSGPLEVRAIARTDGHNIRLYAYQSARVIFAWEINPRELRVNRPDGTAPETASIATAPIKPLAAGVWYGLTWRIDEKVMEVFIDGRRVFEERGRFDLSASRPVAISGGMPTAPESVVDVKSFTVQKLVK